MTRTLFRSPAHNRASGILPASTRSRIHALRMLAVALVVLAATGCAFNNTKPVASYPTLMKQAESSASAGHRDAALAQFKNAANAEPTKAKPWERTAQLQFTAGDYGRAIVAAKEALKRSPSSWVADSVLTVSGLRVAVESLSRLRSKADLKGPERSEAIHLADALRNTLGEGVLVPEAKKTETHHRVRHRRRARAHVAARKPAPASNKQDKSQSSPPKSTGNPFSVLHKSGDD